MQVLEVIINNPMGVGLKELMDKVEISRSSLFILLNTLKSLGYIDQSEKRGRYTAGPRLLAWKVGKSAANPGMDLLTSFYLETENHNLEETLAVVIKGDQEDCIVLGQTESGRDVRVVFSSGQKLGRETAPAIILDKSDNSEAKKNGFILAGRGEAVDIGFPICTDGETPDAVLIYSCPSFRQNAAMQDDNINSLREMAARISYRCGAQYYSPWKDEVPHGVGETLSMSESQIEGLLRSPWMARLACVKPDGSPHVVPVWFEWNKGVINILAWKGSKWAEYINDNHHISLTIDEPWKPFRRISVNGIASLLFNTSSAGFIDLVHRIGTRYLGGNLDQTLADQVDSAYSIQISYLKGWKGI